MNFEQNFRGQIQLLTACWAGRNEKTGINENSFHPQFDNYEDERLAGRLLELGQGQKTLSAVRRSGNALAFLSGAFRGVPVQVPIQAPAR